MIAKGFWLCHRRKMDLQLAPDDWRGFFESLLESLDDRTYWAVRNTCRNVLKNYESIADVALHINNKFHHLNHMDRSQFNTIEKAEFQKYAELNELLAPFMPK